MQQKGKLLATPLLTYTSNNLFQGVLSNGLLLHFLLIYGGSYLGHGLRY